MAMRVTVTLPEDVLERLDAIAAEEGVTRSEVVREASAEYVVSHVASKEARARESAVLDGIEWLQEVAERTATDTRQSIELLRELRGESCLGAPIEPDRGETELP